MIRQSLAAFFGLFIATTGTQATLAYHGKFPGKGSLSAWIEGAKLYDQATSLTKTGKLTAANDLYRAAIKKYRFDSDFYYNLGHNLLEEKKLAEAESALQQSAQLAPFDYIPTSLYGVTLYEEGKYSSAQKVLEKALQLAKTDDQKLHAEQNLKELLDKIHSTRGQKNVP